MPRRCSFHLHLLLPPAPPARCEGLRAVPVGLLPTFGRPGYCSPRVPPGSRRCRGLAGGSRGGGAAASASPGLSSRSPPPRGRAPIVRPSCGAAACRGTAAAQPPSRTPDPYPASPPCPLLSSTPSTEAVSARPSLPARPRTHPGPRLLRSRQQQTAKAAASAAMTAPLTSEAATARREPACGTAAGRGRAGRVDQAAGAVRPPGGLLPVRRPGRRAAAALPQRVREPPRPPPSPPRAINCCIGVVGASQNGAGQ